jgi:hypothetical protein
VSFIRIFVFVASDCGVVGDPVSDEGRQALLCTTRGGPISPVGVFSGAHVISFRLV